MKSAFFVLTLAALAGVVRAEPALPGATAPAGAELAALVAADSQARVPIAVSPDARIVAARSEGHVLVWTLEVPALHFDEARDQNAAAGGAFRDGFCDTESRILFEHGVALRVDVTDGRRAALSLPLITDCPPRGSGGSRE